MAVDLWKWTCWPVSVDRSLGVIATIEIRDHPERCTQRKWLIWYSNDSIKPSPDWDWIYERR